MIGIELEGKRSMPRFATGGIPLSAVLAVCLSALGFLQPAQAKDWKIPDICTNGVTGDDDDDPPIVNAWASSATTNFELEIGPLEFTQNGGKAWVNVNSGTYQTLLLHVSYTPFLDGYVGVGAFYTGWNALDLPDPGAPNTARRKLYRQVRITLQVNNQSLPGAEVQFEPEFAGGSAFTIEANSEAQIDIDCFTTRPGGNPVYVVPKSGTPFDAVVNVTPGVQEGSGIGTLGQRGPYTPGPPPLD
jgi:hypothetical protein